MDVLKALGQTLTKMFAADLGLTLTAVAAIGAAAAALKSGAVGPAVAPFVIALAILAALAFGVYRGARR